ncbi:cytochrome c oxidase subunit II [Prosthecomicrobium pneumaticum]|uniref:Cytochrome aa3 subunit 2 n=1 Tax=Prosthecomicrobium pneumaticum TaxID=81895 RepID=A0A7W9CUV8_9HYPH|nr:cytochrome c oxidase subunit II [Prosthecomicrobium pneumaticum]MBB5752363.1 cytochrome c oxidase subunit 2 [Prosthecomicrobium pneumaticum]
MALAACGGPYSALAPAGPVAANVALLWWIMAAGATIIFLAVFVALAIVWRRPALLGAAPERRLILWGGLALPGAILLLLLAAAFVLGERLVAAAREDEGAIEVIGRRWEWSFRYPGAAGAVSTGTLHIPAGEDVAFRVISEDVIHAFWIPRLGGKIDAIPGHVTRIRLRADAPGVYGGVCAEFCGTDHAAMFFRVEAHPPERYADVLAGLARETGQ